MIRVVILQEYIPQYRVRFFELLREKALELEIDITVAFGDPGTSLASRNDGRGLTFGHHIRQQEYKLFNRRIVLRDTKSVVADADLLILEQARRNIDAYKLLTPPRAPRPLIALWGHGKDYTRKSSRLERRLSRWLTSRADWLFAYTEGGRQAVTEDGFDPGKVTVVQNSIDTSALRDQIMGTMGSAIEEFSNRNDLRGKTALFLGALDSSKRLSFLVKAAEEAHRLDSEYRLVLAGEGAKRPEVEDWARRHSWIKYLGAINGPEKALVMRASQILAVPGRVGLVAVDSFAAGLPILTTQWHLHAPEYEYLKNGINSISTLDDPLVYAETSVNLLNNPSLLAELGTACIQSGSVYTLEAMTDRFIKGITGVLASRSA